MWCRFIRLIESPRTLSCRFSPIAYHRDPGWNAPAEVRIAVVLRSASPLDGVLADHHPDAPARGDPPGGHAIGMGHQRRQLGAVVAGEAVVGEAEPRLPGRLGG